MTRSWSQFRDNACTSLSPTRKAEETLRPAVTAVAANLLPTSRPLRITSEQTTSVGPALIRSLSPTSAGMSQGTTSTIGCIPTDTSSQVTVKPTEPANIPRRNLSEAFEELYVAPSTNRSTTTPGVKQPSGTTAAEKMSNIISPTGVADLDNTSGPGAHLSKTLNTQSNVVTPPPEPAVVEHDDSSCVVSYFRLHPDLKLDLSQGVVNRVSMYGVIHDINKEATSMAANDDSSFSKAADENSEEFSPLVVAINGPPSKSSHSGENSMVDMALIDDERWLLSAIDARGDDESRPNQVCPPTFLQAMGEREYENPLASLSNGSRTQLWKPSRSWWEAKSGKNPWIEPKSHNKRWRYLWPLIHYHKFLAKCIKKLKRNGVDVKMSVSPVAAFLREEVCAVSDHLAAVSLFDSDEWMKCLEHFTGWTDASEDSEARLRKLVSKLKLRPLAEPGDVDSPLLRSQIDDQFLRAMVAARTQMEMSGETSERRKAAKVASRSQANQSREGRESCSQPASGESMASQSHKAHAHNPMYHNKNSSSPYHQVPSNVGSQHRTTGGVRRPRYPYQWWGHGYGGPAPYAFGDDNGSVHSSISGDAYNDFAMFSTATPHAGYYPPVFHPPAYSEQQQPTGGFDPAVAEHPMFPGPDPYNNAEQAVQNNVGWVGHGSYDPGMAFALQQNPDAQGYYVTPVGPPSPHEMHSPYHIPTSDGVMGCNPSVPMEPFSEDQTPFKYEPSQMPMSPFWAHLDRATLAMGLATPQTNPPKTPLREGEEEKEVREIEETSGDTRGSDTGFVGNAQPLLLRQPQYYGYGPYGPPSPATQFMMSPQASFAYNYGYGFSPGRCNSHAKGKLNIRSPPQTDPASLRESNGKNVSTEKRSSSRLSPTNSPNKVVCDEDRESPSTVDTIAESESVADSA